MTYNKQRIGESRPNDKCNIAGHMPHSNRYCPTWKQRQTNAKETAQGMGIA